MSAPANPPASTPAAKPKAGVAPDGRHYASWPKRAFGYFIDVLPCLILWTIANIFFFSWTKIVPQTYYGETYPVVETSFPGVPFYGLFLISALYFFWNKGYLEGKTGKSIGKRLLGMTTETQRPGGGPVGVKTGMARAFLVALEYFTIFLAGLGIILWVWPAFDSRRQAIWSDRACAAVVYDDKKR